MGSVWAVRGAATLCRHREGFAGAGRGAGWVLAAVGQLRCADTARGLLGDGGIEAA